MKSRRHRDRPLLAIPFALLVLPAAILPAAIHAQSTEALQAALERGRVELGAPGAAVAVVFPDGTSWTGVAGEAFPGTPVTPATRFQLGSVTKIYTAALVVQLAREGLVDLDAPVADAVPEATLPPGATLRQLLNHTSGMADIYDDSTFARGTIMNPLHAWTAEAHLARVGPPVGRAGASWRYSSSGYVAASLLVERATGRPFARLVHERLLAALGLAATHVGGVDQIPGPRAHALLDINGDGTLEDLSVMVPFTGFFTAAGASGNLVATAGDAARWLHALATGDVVDSTGWSERTTWVDRPDGNGHGLGLLRVKLDGTPLIGHRGNTAGFSAAVWHVPDEGVTLAVLTNAHGILVTPLVSAVLAALRQ